MTLIDDVPNELKAKANLNNVGGMTRYGMTAERRSGVLGPDMQKIAKDFGKNHTLARTQQSCHFGATVHLFCIFDEHRFGFKIFSINFSLDFLDFFGAFEGFSV